MSLDWVEVHNVRNIEQALVTLNPGMTLVSGPNGSGKTSLLEAVHVLGTGRSFRSPTFSSLISRQAKECLVRGALHSGVSLGVRRSRGGDRDIRLNREDVSRVSELARILPLVVLDGDTIELVTGQPEVRRRFLNWGLFHVEHSFQDNWAQAIRCLKQHNSALRAGSRGQILLWRKELAAISSRIDDQRVFYLDQLTPQFVEMVTTCTGIEDVALNYRRGWPEGEQLVDSLAEVAQRDEEKGFTSRGFHRADVKIQVNGQDAAATCSRGEIKMLAWLLRLAQANRAGLAEDGGKVVHLVDDPVAELDARHLEAIFDLLRQGSRQLIMTGTDSGVLQERWASNASMFHVEHGVFKETA